MYIFIMIGASAVDLWSASCWVAVWQVGSQRGRLLARLTKSHKFTNLTRFQHLQCRVFDRLRPTVKYDSVTYSHLFALCTLGASCCESWNDCSLPLGGGGLMLAGGCLDSCLEVGGNLAPSTPTGRLTKSWLEKSIRSGGWCLKTRYLYTVACMTARVLGPCAQGACRALVFYVWIRSWESVVVGSVV